MSTNIVLNEAEKIAKDDYLRMVLALVTNGIPFDVAFSLEWSEIVGWNVIIGELKSGKIFDWGQMDWVEKQ